MASRKMTFNLPEELAKRLVRRVPARERSAYVAEALKEKLTRRDRQLIEACQAANEEADLVVLEKEMDALNDDIAEPWDDGAAR